MSFINPHVEGPTADDLRVRYCRECGEELPQDYPFKVCAACAEDDWTERPLTRCAFPESMTRPINRAFHDNDPADQIDVPED